MPLIEQISQCELERLVVDRVVPALQDRGFFYTDHFLSEPAGELVLDRVMEMHHSGMLQDGRLAAGTGRAGSVTRVHSRKIRGDQMAWVSGAERNNEPIRFLLALMDKLIRLSLDRLGNRGIRERSQAMVACYPGHGTGYVKHVDNPNSDGRCITCVYYLNKNWNAKEHGGVLRIFPEGQGYVVDIEPLFDRLLLFWSDRRNPHEVQPCYATRYAITVWYFDSEERAAAKRRFRDLAASTQEEGSSTS
ncbi:egl nine homolog 3 [Lampris incognitus]|uniref:egl nine homolog 3 n=1 Tax=Lampris incognitus TaxID=2546036 RepID=UPI0024B56531|nr:egl nine homolog 3 [Lampris incognitus]